MAARSVLVMSTDALAAALLGALVEIEGYTPHFLRDGEGAREALRRVRPHVAVVECDYPEACSAAFLGPAKMMGTRVILFGRPGLAAAMRECAERFQLLTLAMPPAPGALGRAFSDEPAP